MKDFNKGNVVSTTMQGTQPRISEIKEGTDDGISKSFLSPYFSSLKEMEDAYRNIVPYTQYSDDEEGGYDGESTILRENDKIKLIGSDLCKQIQIVDIVTNKMIGGIPYKIDTMHRTTSVSYYDFQKVFQSLSKEE